MELMAKVWIPSAGQLLIGVALILSLAALVLIAVFSKWGSYWLQAYMSGADMSMKSLIVMSFLRIEHRLIVTAKVMGRQAGLRIDREGGMSTDRLLAHHLAGGDVMHVVRAIIAAQRAGIELDFDRAAAIDLAGRDVLLAVQTSVSPRVISCPPQDGEGKNSISAVAKNGVELLVGARVTVRTNLDQLIGGATEETITARVGQGIVSAIGSAEFAHGRARDAGADLKRRDGTWLGRKHRLLRLSRSILPTSTSERTLGHACRPIRPTLILAVARAQAEVRRAKCRGPTAANEGQGKGSPSRFRACRGPSARSAGRCVPRRTASSKADARRADQTPQRTETRHDTPASKQSSECRRRQRVFHESLPKSERAKRMNQISKHVAVTTCP